MARYSQLKIFKDAYKLCIYCDKVVHSFSRYHKYTTGKDLRETTRDILILIVEINNLKEKQKLLLDLRINIEKMQIFSRLALDIAAFPKGLKTYSEICKQTSGIARQCEGWIKYNC